MNILLVHGYAVSLYEGGHIVMGTMARYVCDSVKQVAKDYEKILCLGGWHKDIGPDPTIGQAMAAELEDAGIPEDKILTQFELGMVNRMPARETMEEVEIAGEMLEQLPKDSALSRNDLSVDAMVIWTFAERVRFLYDHRGMQAVTIIPVHSHVDQDVIRSCAARMVEVAADPMGKSEKAKKHFAERTLGKGFRNPHRE